MPDHYNVLFLCTGNSARSILAECILNHKGGERFTAFSAGSHPSGQPRPEALRLLAAKGISTASARSKSWDEFSAPDAPQLDLIFTVCDNAANEQCPFWPGAPLTVHWGIPDPAAVQGSEAEVMAAFLKAFSTLERRMDRLLALPVASLTREALADELRALASL